MTAKSILWLSILHAQRCVSLHRKTLRVTTKSNDTQPSVSAAIKGRSPVLLSAISMLLLWCSGPPIRFWPAAMIALVPLIRISLQSWPSRKTWVWPVYLCGCVYWLIVLEGIRHAHPALYAGWIAMSFYLAIYPVFFVGLTKSFLAQGWTLLTATSLSWLITELIRNYFATGVSVAMLGHALADVSPLIQIANLGGTYLVSMLLVVINVAIAGIATKPRDFKPAIVAVVALAASILYSGLTNSKQTKEDGGQHVLLLQRNDSVEFDQDQSRETEIFDAYSRQMIQSLDQSDASIDIVVWPESMFNGGVPWYIVDPEPMIPPEESITREELAMFVQERCDFFSRRAQYLQSLASDANNGTTPSLLVGCGVAQYSATGPCSYSGLVSIDPAGKVNQWYGKHHLVMFGEYIPILSSIPGIRNLIPPGLGVTPGNDNSAIEISDQHYLPNICIETAVERVPVSAMRDAIDRGQSVDAIVTVTNDRWFDQSWVVEHHLRCAQLIAVGTGRPVLSSAHGGPTAWIDRRGQVVKRLPLDVDGEIHATIQDAVDVTWYVRLQDWPHWVIATGGILAAFWPRHKRNGSIANKV
jgi:apolipoprotein N-acyltransferase